MPAVEKDLSVGKVEVDKPAVRPTVVLLDEVVGKLVVADGHERLDAVASQTVEDSVIECETRLAGRTLLARGKQPRPVDRQAKHANRTQVEEESQVLADGEKPLLGTGLVRLGVSPLGPTDRSEKNRVGLPGSGESLVGERRGLATLGLGRIDGGPADEAVLADELDVMMLPA